MTAAAAVPAAVCRPVGFMIMPAGFSHKEVFLKGRPKHTRYDAFWRRHPPMPASHWAKIYAPFDALDGFDEGISAKEVLYTRRCELSDGQKEELDRRLSLLAALTAGRRAAVTDRPSITIVFFAPCTDPYSDAYDSGGRYEKVRGTVLKIDALITRAIHVLTKDGEKNIPLDDVVSISGDLFDRETFDLP